MKLEAIYVVFFLSHCCAIIISNSSVEQHSLNKQCLGLRSANILPVLVGVCAEVHYVYFMTPMCFAHTVQPPLSPKTAV